MKERHKTRSVVFLLLLRDNPNDIEKKQICIQKRINTGYMDGMYDACVSGHLEPNESILEAVQREAKEEIDIDIKKQELKLILTYHASEKINDIEYLRFYFLTENHQGEIKIGETNKCSELNWVDIKKLPENTIWHLKKAVEAYLNGLNYIQDEF